MIRVVPNPMAIPVSVQSNLIQDSSGIGQPPASAPLKVKWTE